MRKLTWPASWRLAMSNCAVIRLRTCDCILSMACNRRPVSSLASLCTALSSLPSAIASAAWVARLSGRVRLRVISKPSVPLSSTTISEPPTSSLRESSIDSSATSAASAASLSCSAMFSAILSCHCFSAGAALVSSNGNAWSLWPDVTRSMTLLFISRTFGVRLSTSARMLWPCGVDGIAYNASCALV